MNFPLLLMLFILDKAFPSTVEENGLYYISSNDYNEFNSSHNYTLALFFSHPCPLCKQIIHELESASELLNSFEHPVQIAIVNYTQNDDIVHKLNLNTKISLKFIINGNPTEYTGGRSSEDIASWVRNKLGRSIGEVNDPKEIEQLREVVRTLVVFFGDDPQMFKLFEKASGEIDDAIFIKCKTEECLMSYTCKNGNVILFKNYDERKNEFKRQLYTLEELTTFLEASSRPSVMKFNRKTAQFIFDESHPGLFIYREKSLSNNYEDMLLKISPLIKGKLQPVLTDIVDGIEIELADKMGVKKNELPVVMIHDTREGLKSYKLSARIDEENLLTFISDWEENRLGRFIKSQPIPTNQEDGAFILVGTTIEEYINSEDKDVIVMFYAPWCKYCKDFMPIYDKLAKKYNKSSKILLAKFDAYNNEVSGIHLKYYPTIALWKAKDKSNYMIFQEERTEENLIKFVARHCSHYLTTDL